MIVDWFQDNYVAIDADKCHLIVSSYKHAFILIYAKVEDAWIWEEKSVKFLGHFIDSDLSFHGHEKVMCKKKHCRNSPQK